MDASTKIRDERLMALSQLEQMDVVDGKEGGSGAALGELEDAEARA